MNETNLQKAKEIIADNSHDALFLGKSGRGMTYESRALQCLRFTLLALESDIPTVNALDAVSKNSHDLVHLSGVHKFKWAPGKIDELRFFWGMWWETLAKIPHVQEYVESVCEASSYRAGKARRPFQLFGVNTTSRPWRTPEWYASRRKITEPVAPISQFYPYITDAPTEEHRLIMQVDALIPKGMRNDMHADICQEMLVDIYSGKLTVDQIRGSVKSYISRFFRQNHLWKSVSIDAPVFGSSGKRTLAEILAAPGVEEGE